MGGYGYFSFSEVRFYVYIPTKSSDFHCHGLEKEGLVDQLLPAYLHIRTFNFYKKYEIILVTFLYHLSTLL